MKKPTSTVVIYVKIIHCALTPCFTCDILNPPAGAAASCKCHLRGGEKKVMDWTTTGLCSLFCVMHISMFFFFLKLFACRVTKEGVFMIPASLILQGLCKKGLKISGSCWPKSCSEQVEQTRVEIHLSFYKIWRNPIVFLEAKSSPKRNWIYKTYQLFYCFYEVSWTSVI